MVKLFVTNLPLNCSFKEIRDLFLVFGPLKNINQFITERKENENIQSVFVEYFNEEDAIDAMEKLNNQKIHGIPIKIEKAFERFHKLWVGKLPSTITSKDLYDHFTVFGEIESIQREKENDFAFVVFKDQTVTELLINSQSKQKIRGISLEVKKAFSKKEADQRIIPANRAICIKNLPSKTAENELKVYFKEIGSLEKIQISNTRAILVFTTELAALKAIKYKNNKLFKTKKINLKMYQKNVPHVRN